MAADGLHFPKVELGADAVAIRRDVRAFLARELDHGGFTPRADSWGTGMSPEFSRRLGAAGFLGITWPKRYGGREKSALERYVVTEELLAHGAPCAMHWIADRQSGPLLLRFGTEEQRQEVLPRIAKGECYFAIGMSEPDSGSDLASLRTSARKTDGGWLLTGRKIWSSGAHLCHFMIVLCRTSPRHEANRHEGLSQMLVDLKSPGISIRPINNLAGEHHFNETVFDDVFVPEGRVVGRIGDGWRQVVSELAIERSGPERFLSTFTVLKEMVREVGAEPGERAEVTIGQLVARLKTLRRMSLGVGELLDDGKSPVTEAALVKEVGTRYEREVVEGARQLLPSRPHGQAPDRYGAALADGILHVPSATIRGGTNEVLRGIVARELGLR